MINGPLGFDYADVRVPVPSFHGTSDTNVPIEENRDLVRRLPDAALTELGQRVRRRALGDNGAVAGMVVAQRDGASGDRDPRPVVFV